jgi:hypothetical protein
MHVPLSTHAPKKRALRGNVVVPQLCVEAEESAATPKQTTPTVQTPRVISTNHNHCPHRHHQHLQPHRHHHLVPSRPPGRHTQHPVIVHGTTRSDAALLCGGRTRRVRDAVCSQRADPRHAEPHARSQGIRHTQPAGTQLSSSRPTDVILKTGSSNRNSWTAAECATSTPRVAHKTATTNRQYLPW